MGIDAHSAETLSRIFGLDLDHDRDYYTAEVDGGRDDSSDVDDSDHNSGNSDNQNPKQDQHTNDNPTHSGAILFPELHTIYWIKPMKNRMNGGTDRSDIIGLIRFLLHRQNIGFPVAQLDLTAFDRSYFQQDLCGLEQVDGLKVLWKVEIDTSSGGGGNKVRSYVCGTGHPERLSLQGK